MGQVLQMRTVSTVKPTAIDAEYAESDPACIVRRLTREKASTRGNCSVSWESVAFASIIRSIALPR